VRVWRASDLSLVRVLRGHRGSVLCLLAVGNVLLSGARDNTIRWGLHEHCEGNIGALLRLPFFSRAIILVSLKSLG